MKERRSRLPATSPARARARKLRFDPTPAERVLWESLRDRRLEGFKFRRQSPVGIYITDFHCRELNLVIEVDGEGHKDPRQAAYDRNRDLYLQSLGCTVLRFSNREVFEQPDVVLARIMKAAKILNKAKT